MVAIGPTTDLGELVGLVLCGGATPGKHGNCGGSRLRVNLTARSGRPCSDGRLPTHEA